MALCIFYMALVVVVSLVRMIWYCVDKKGTHGKIITMICLAVVLLGLVVPFVSVSLYGSEAMLVYFTLCGFGEFVGLFSLGAAFIRWSDRKQYLSLLKIKKDN